MIISFSVIDPARTIGLPGRYEKEKKNFIIILYNNYH